MSWDTLSFLIGLTFLFIALLGSVWAKVRLGKIMRIVVGLAGATLVACCFWYHSAFHAFRVTSVQVDSPRSRAGSCPLRVDLRGSVGSSGSGEVKYYFEFSDGNASGVQTAHYQRSDSGVVRSFWQVNESLNDGWVRLHVLAPNESVSGRSEPFSVKCVIGGQVGETQPGSRATATADTAQIPVVADSTDWVTLDSGLPASGIYLKRGQPVTFNINVSYNLASADSAFLFISTVQLRASAAGCAGAVGELVDAAKVVIVKGVHRAVVNLTWSGDTGSATRGSILGNGYLSFSPSFWVNNGGTRGERIDFFGTDANHCYK